MGSLFPDKDVPGRGYFLVPHPFFPLLGPREPRVHSSASVLPLEPQLVAGSLVVSEAQLHFGFGGNEELV